MKTASQEESMTVLDEIALQFAGPPEGSFTIKEYCAERGIDYTRHAKTLRRAFQIKVDEKRLIKCGKFGLSIYYMELSDEDFRIVT